MIINSNLLDHQRTQDNQIYQKFIGRILATPVALRTTRFVCDHAEEKKTTRETNDKTPPPVAKRIRKASIKVNCSAKFTKYYMMSDNSVKVKYTWKHIIHNPYKINRNYLKNLQWETLPGLLLIGLPS